MWRLGRRAAARGFEVHNVGYPSRRAAIDVLAERVGVTLSALAGRAGPHHVVTHSMGGIVLRAAVAGGWLPAAALRRVVMLAPPSAGSELADALARSPLFRLTVGPAGPQLRTGGEGVPGALPPVSFELGVIAGSRARNPLFARVFDGPNDGKVSVERAAVAGMRDFLALPCGHTFIMDDAAAVRQIFHFLAHGAFAREPETLAERDDAVLSSP
jgi:hypothetical protein